MLVTNLPVNGKFLLSTLPAGPTNNECWKWKLNKLQTELKISQNTVNPKTHGPKTHRHTMKEQGSVGGENLPIEALVP
jgi:hypothetical protein